MGAAIHLIGWAATSLPAVYLTRLGVAFILNCMAMRRGLDTELDVGLSYLHLKTRQPRRRVEKERQSIERSDERKG